MNADAEKRPALVTIRKRKGYEARLTHEYQGSIEVVVVLLVEVSVILVGLFAELFVEARIGFLFLLPNIRFEGTGQDAA